MSSPNERNDCTSEWENLETIRNVDGKIINKFLEYSIMTVSHLCKGLLIYFDIISCFRL